MCVMILDGDTSRNFILRYCLDIVLTAVLCCIRCYDRHPIASNTYVNVLAEFLVAIVTR